MSCYDLLLRMLDIWSIHSQSNVPQRHHGQGRSSTKLLSESIVASWWGAPEQTEIRYRFVCKLRQPSTWCPFCSVSYSWCPCSKSCLPLLLGWHGGVTFTTSRADNTDFQYGKYLSLATFKANPLGFPYVHKSIGISINKKETDKHTNSWEEMSALCPVIQANNFDTVNTSKFVYWLNSEDL